eukprot:Colp12_sorted_trinity150504_noHs@33927
MQRDFNIATVVFAFCSFVFFIIGCIGYASDKDVMENTAWVTIDDHGEKAWINLVGIYSKGAGGTGVQTYADFSCTADFCDTCASTGDAAFALIIVATVFSSFNIVLSGILSSSPSSTLQLVNLFVAFITAVFSLIGFAIFMGGCYVKIEDFTPLSTHYGPGAIITLLGLLMMWVAVFLQIGAVAFGVK